MKILDNGIAIIDGDTHISKWVQQSGRLDHDQNTLPLLSKHIPHGGTVVDVGAFIGDHTLHYARCVGVTGSVVALEPNPYAFACLKHNMVDHRQVTCLNVGASDSEHRAGLVADANAGATHAREGTSAAMVSIDKLYLAACHFMKFDCEGYEVRALHGAFQTLRMYHPVLLIEVNEGALSRQGVKPSDIFDILDDLGYVSVNIHKGQPMAGPQYDILATWNT
jgi:FkbM family methyltransferase